MSIKINRIMIPFFYYLTATWIVEILVFGSGWFGEDVILWNTLFRAIAVMPGLLYWYRQDQTFRGEIVWNEKRAFVLILAGAIASGLCRLGIEAVGMLDYAAAEKALLSGDLWLQVLVLVGVSPVLEEFLFRGVLYGRLKEIGSAGAAMVCSSLLFGLYHGNLSQGIYGFFMGLFLSWSMEWCQTVKAPIAVHASANLVVLLLTMR